MTAMQTWRVVTGYRIPIAAARENRSKLRAIYASADLDKLMADGDAYERLFNAGIVRMTRFQLAAALYGHGAAGILRSARVPPWARVSFGEPVCCVDVARCFGCPVQAVRDAPVRACEDRPLTVDRMAASVVVDARVAAVAASNKRDVDCEWYEGTCVDCGAIVWLNADVYPKDEPFFHNISDDARWRRRTAA